MDVFMWGLDTKPHEIHMNQFWWWNMKLQYWLAWKMIRRNSRFVFVCGEQFKDLIFSAHIGPQPPRIMAAALDKKNFLFIDVDDDGPNFLPLFSLWGSCFLSSSRDRQWEKDHGGGRGLKSTPFCPYGRATR